MSRMITAAPVAVAVERVRMACAMSDSRSTLFRIVSKPAAVVGLSTETRRPSPPRSSHRAATAAAGDRGARAPPWCIGMSSTSARACMYSATWTSFPHRRRGAAPETPSWPTRNVPRAGRRDTRGAPVRAASCLRGCRADLPCPGCGDRGGRIVPDTSHPEACS